MSLIHIKSCNCCKLIQAQSNLQKELLEAAMQAQDVDQQVAYQQELGKLASLNSRRR